MEMSSQSHPEVYFTNLPGISKTNQAHNQKKLITKPLYVPFKAVLLERSAVFHDGFLSQVDPSFRE
jgi:hypothetical protein